MLGKEAARDPLEEEEHDREEGGSEEDEEEVSESEPTSSQITVTDAGGHDEDEEHHDEEEGEDTVVDEEKEVEEGAAAEEEEGKEKDHDVTDSPDTAAPTKSGSAEEPSDASGVVSASDTDGAPADDLHEEGFELQDDEHSVVDLGPFESGDHALQGAEDLSEHGGSPGADASSAASPGTPDSLEASRREYRPGAAVGTRADRPYDADVDTRGSSDSAGRKEQAASPAGGKKVGLNVPGGGSGGGGGGGAEASEGGEDVFDWLRRVSCQMDSMGITEQLQKKYGDERPVVIDNPSSSSEPQEVPAITITDSERAMRQQRQSATQTSAPPPQPGAGQWERQQGDGRTTKGRPPDRYDAGYGAAHQGESEESWDDTGYDQQDEQDGDWEQDAWDAVGGEGVEWSESEIDHPCGQCRCCRAMLRAVTGGAAEPPPPPQHHHHHKHRDSADVSLSSRQDSLLEQLRAGGGGSAEDLLDAEISSLTVSTGTADSCDAPARDDDCEQQRVRDSRKWLKTVTDDFLRSRNVRELVLKNDWVEPGRVRSKMTRVMRCKPQPPPPALPPPETGAVSPGECGGGGARGDRRRERRSSARRPLKDAWSANRSARGARVPRPVTAPCSGAGGGRQTRPAVSPLRMSTRLMDGRELAAHCLGASGPAAAANNPTRQFIDTYLERTARNGRSKSTGRTGNKRTNGKATKRLITISTNLKS